MAGHDLWATPHALYEVLNHEFLFTLDAAADESNTKCHKWLGPGSSIGEDALTASWDSAVVWCNPPYSGGNLTLFVKRAWEQVQEHHNTVVMLLPAYTDPKYWWDYVVPFADEVRFLKGRLQFLENGVKKQSARFPSAVVVFRWRPGVQQKTAHCWWWDWKA